ncbi:MAG: hypothetical protein JST54_14350 [Deltaproteobacteria bacterium]|nr:hypothetical protein [Deltaproteobacteria bacterium]
MNVRHPVRALPLVLLLASGACRCGEGAGPRAYDVGVPLADLPGAQPAALSAAVPGPVLLYAETADGRALARQVQESAWFLALQKSGSDRALALSGAGATLTALAQRLNDLSRNPIGDEALGDLLDGPLAVAVRPRARGGFDLLVLKSVSASQQGALKLAQMLEAVHPSASALRVDRHRGLPVRALRVDGTHQLYYVVLRDRLLLASDDAWLKAALDVALGQAAATEQPAVHAVQSQAAHDRGFAAIDTEVALRSPSLGTGARALAGLSWVGFRWTDSGVELGVRRAHGTFGQPGPPLPLPPNAALALWREASLSELLALPEPVDTGAPLDGGAPDAGPPDAHALAGRALLAQVQAALEPALEGHALYALSREAEPEPAVELAKNAPPEPHRPAQHLLALSTRSPATPALDALAPALFRAPPAHRDELAPGARCEGSPAAVCWAELGPMLAMSTAPSALKLEGDPARVQRATPSGPFSIYLDAAELAGLLGRAATGSKRHAPAELDALAAALRTEPPLLAKLERTKDGHEAWGPVLPTLRPIEPKRESKDGGAP